MISSKMNMRNVDIDFHWPRFVILRDFVVVIVEMVSEVFIKYVEVYKFEEVQIIPSCEVD